MSRNVAGSSSTTRSFRHEGTVRASFGESPVGSPTDAAGFGIVLMRISKTVPRSLPMLSTPSVPPCDSTIPLQIASPSPRPPYLRVILVSPCWNGSKIRGRISGSIPIPVSETSMTRLSPRSPCSFRERIVIAPPSGVNLMAFLIRFQITCWNLAGSALT